MSVVIGAGVLTLIAAGYVGRKGWLAFHRAVGITPGKMKYIESSQQQPKIRQLSLSAERMQDLPPSVLQQLQRIDTKAQLLQQWRDELTQSGQTPAVSEEEFLVNKLLKERLPELLTNYQRLARHDTVLQQTQPDSPTQSHGEGSALNLVFELLITIEAKLDALLTRYQHNTLQDMQVMQRYLQQRQ